MKKALFILLFVFCLLVCGGAWAYEDTPDDVRLSQTASGRGNEYVTELSEGWKFGGGREDASAKDYADKTWTTVNLPHTWNIQDASDGDGKYSRTSYWYRRTLDMDASFEGKRIYLEFLGANQQTDLYVNGEHIKLCGSDEYTHKGGYTAFRYDMTDALRVGANVLAVKVDNTRSEEIAPISGDFNMYGGIYRRVYMIAVDEVHIDLADSGSSGLFLTTPNVRSKERPDDFGTLNIRADIVNDSTRKRTVTVTAHIEGDNAPEDIVRTVTVRARGSARFDETVFISDPHLWKGIDYSGESDNSDVGYRYRVTLTVSDEEKTIDAVTEEVGFRYFYVDKETGFYLNGESHPLRGVNRHSFKLDMGSAITEAEHDEDIALIMELGANAIRLSHYPQTDYFYDLCDANGIVLWTEIPVVNAVGTDKGFLKTTQTQLTELIRQQYNRPSVCFWGLENEIGDNTRSQFLTVKQLLSALDQLAHQEDPCGRYTTQAVKKNMAMDGNDLSNLLNDEADVGWKSDLIAWNIYPGWYSSFKGTFEEIADDKTAGDSRPMGLSEYGWGSSVKQHELYPELGRNDLLPAGKWHPEEYQNIMHEQAVQYINEHENLWATFVWCMFDFDVDSRNEGDRAGQNDKGLVTNDRKIKKDSFYLYKANWDRREPFVYITGARFNQRKNVKTYVKVYSNCDSVDLYMNGRLLGAMENRGSGVFLVEDLDLDVGENKLRAVGRSGDSNCSDTCLWTRPALSTTLLASAALPVDTEAGTVTLSRPMTLGEIRGTLTGVDNATYEIMWNDAELTEENAVVFSGMTAVVRSENGEKTKTYTFISENLFTGKSVSATSIEKNNIPENAIDGNQKTQWVAVNNTYPQSIIVDLGQSYRLGTLIINWNAKENRSYTYSVEVSQDGTNYVTAVSRLTNKKSGTTRDDLHRTLGRYVKIDVQTCSNPKSYASIVEMKIDGWSAAAQGCEIDHSSRLIIVPDIEGLTWAELSSRLETSGGCAFFYRQETDAVEEGAQVILAEISGREIAYTVTTRENAHLYPADLALDKPVYFSSEEGTASTGEETYAVNVNDGLTDTCWVADTKVKGVPGKTVKYPEWIAVDLGAEYNLSEIELRFETKGKRIYQFQVYASSDIPPVSNTGFPSGYRLLADQSANKSAEGGHYTFSVEGETGRYIAVCVLGNNLYPESKNIAACIYDFKVYGTVMNGEEGE